ncbi:cytochrome c oxidase subunit 3 [Rhodanobacter sp. AS-Z3]|uniref:cytochrome c oxidase subunit 3 n=1 Tax=Rhodanobacter sp. AS-Z3 TaxID=3031330 RepID=UPI002479A1E7|nr:cytochrome c oxidase subunit 3 [Rhodanobacter sp. AS-Z3]WEN13947.1 cytochrome c oxidase subunit 3 [Rhodanobacter sp. AS-Z3]
MNLQVTQPPEFNLGSEFAKADPIAEKVMFGFWAFLMSDAILFGMVFATYVTSLHGMAGGPGPRQLYDLNSIFIETLLLLISSFTFGMASLALKYQHRRTRLVGWLLLTLLLGVAFLCLELHDFASMFAKGGVPTRSGFLSAFFGLVPLHGLHVAAGCIWLIALLGQLARYGLDTATQLGIKRLALFWHFLDIIWIAIFSVVYLAGLA